MKKLILLLLLGAAPLCAQSPQIPITGNIGPGGLFGFRNADPVSMTDANLNLSYPATSAGFVKVTSSVSLTTTRNIVEPFLSNAQCFENLTTGGQSIQVVGLSGSGVAIANGTYACVQGDGTNYVTQASGGGSMTWPAAVGIPCYSGSSSWCTSYSASNQIPGNYLTVFGPSGSGHAPGAVPDPGGSSGTTHYLREDGTWDVPSSSGAVASVSNSDSTLTISPTTGAVVASLNLANSDTWTGLQTFDAGLTVPDSTSDTVKINTSPTLNWTLDENFNGGDVTAYILHPNTSNAEANLEIDSGGGHTLILSSGDNLGDVDINMGGDLDMGYSHPIGILSGPTLTWLAGSSPVLSIGDNAIASDGISLYDSTDESFGSVAFFEASASTGVSLLIDDASANGMTLGLEGGNTGLFALLSNTPLVIPKGFGMRTGTTGPDDVSLTRDSAGVMDLNGSTPSDKQGSLNLKNLTITGICTGCGSGSSGITGQVAGYLPLANTATTLNAPSNIDDGVTTAATLTAHEPLNISASGASNISVGTDGSAAGTVTFSNGSASAHTIFGSAATTSNTILGFATAPTTGDLIDCVVSGTTCTLTDAGMTTSSLVTLTGTQTLANKTIDGVTPTTMGFVDPTSSIQTQLGTKAPLASPTFTGTPAAPTASAGTSTTQLATTAFVQGAAYPAPNITITVGSGVSFSANTCSSYTGTASTASTTTMTGLTTGMTITHTPTTDISAVTGWSPATGGQLYFQPWPTAGSLKDYVCNPTGTTIVTGGSVTWNVSAR